MDFKKQSFELEIRLMACFMDDTSEMLCNIMHVSADLRVIFVGAQVKENNNR